MVIYRRTYPYSCFLLWIESVIEELVDNVHITFSLKKSCIVHCVYMMDVSMIIKVLHAYWLVSHHIAAKMCLMNIWQNMIFLFRSQFELFVLGLCIGFRFHKNKGKMFYLTDWEHFEGTPILSSWKMGYFRFHQPITTYMGLVILTFALYLRHLCQIKARKM